MYVCRNIYVYAYMYIRMAFAAISENIFSKKIILHCTYLHVCIYVPHHLRQEISGYVAHTFSNLSLSIYIYMYIHI